MLHITSGADAGQIPPPPRQSSERYVKSAALAEQPSASTPFLELITGSTCEPCRNRHQTPHWPWPVSRAPRARGTKSTASQAQAGARGSDPPAPLRPCIGQARGSGTWTWHSGLAPPRPGQSELGMGTHAARSQCKVGQGRPRAWVLKG